MSEEVMQLLNLLELEKVEQNLYRGFHLQGSIGRVFGGQVVGQALSAAYQTIEQDRLCHSLHAYFMRGGDPSVPIVYSVERLRDGGSFSTRRVTAIQHGQAIYAMSCSFQIDEPGLTHQMDMAHVPKPDELLSVQDLMVQFKDTIPQGLASYFSKKRPLDLKPVNIQRHLTKQPDKPEQNLWFKAASDLPKDPRIHHCILAYASDMTLLGTSLIPHGKAVFDPDIMPASLDHALWFHRPFAMDNWLLYAQDSPSSHFARGFARGMIYDSAGTLVASAAQEGLIRQV